MITVYATNMIYAQGFELTPEQRAELTAKADRFREITNTTELTSIRVPVRNPRGGDLVGHLTYML